MNKFRKSSSAERDESSVVAWRLTEDWQLEYVFVSFEAS